MPKTAKLMKRGACLTLALFISGAFADTRTAESLPSVFSASPAQTLLAEPDGFNRGSLLAPEYQSNSVSGFSFLNPNRFSMRQSYSVNFASGSFGSTSAGLYLNTLSYKLADPLTLTADVGFHTPLYSSGGFSGGGFQDPRLGSSLVMPHVGLEYKPTKNTSFSLHLFNGRDAAKAYGPFDPYLNPWSR